MPSCHKTRYATLTPPYPPIPYPPRPYRLLDPFHPRLYTVIGNVQSSRHTSEPESTGEDETSREGMSRRKARPEPVLFWLVILRIGKKVFFFVCLSQEKYN